MQNFTIQTKRNLALSIFLSSLTVFLLFIWQGNKGFNLGDEGFLWYGAQRVMLGEVPIRDFMAYDPGRYYWSAALMDVLGDNGIMSLRISVAIFQVLGLCTGLFLIARSLKRPNALYVLLSCLILVTWMYPRHKLFDISLSLFIIGALTALIENPTNKRFFITGLCIGLIAIFGRNHGVYAVFGSFGAMAWLNIKKDQNIDFLRNFAWWLLGIIAGFLPLILMAIFIPGFALAFLESIRFLFEIKSTNLTIPIPWPWLTQFDSANWGESLKNSFIGLFFFFYLYSF